MKLRSAALSMVLAAALPLTAQYCSPTFTNGCFLWRNQEVNIGTINWTLGASDCMLSDYTGQSTVVTPGVAVPMTVVSGNWTGCAVWVDLNNNAAFEDSENLFYSYVGGDPSYTYSFSITLPIGTPAGSYRMRVVAPWGSDGFLDTNVNGYGPCGSYQYGNFDDFTLIVSGTGVAERINGTLGGLSLVPNPCTDLVSVTAPGDDPLERIVILGADGKLLKDFALTNATRTSVLDLADLAPGTYVVQAYGGEAVWTTRLTRQ